MLVFQPRIGNGGDVPAQFVELVGREALHGIQLRRRVRTVEQALGSRLFGQATEVADGVQHEGTQSIDSDRVGAVCRAVCPDRGGVSAGARIGYLQPPDREHGSIERSAESGQREPAVTGNQLIACHQQHEIPALGVTLFGGVMQQHTRLLTGELADVAPGLDVQAPAKACQVLLQGVFKMSRRVADQPLLRGGQRPGAHHADIQWQRLGRCGISAHHGMMRCQQMRQARRCRSRRTERCRAVGVRHPAPG